MCDVKSMSAATIKSDKQNALTKMDQEEDFGLISVRQALNSEKIKLWLAPYHEEGKDTSDCLNALAETLKNRIKIPKDVVFRCLKILQEKSMENIKEKEAYQKSGLANLLIRAPRRQDESMNLKIDLSSVGTDLKVRISEFYQIPPNKLKLISQGLIIKDNSTLESQGLKHGSKIMTLLITSCPEEMEAFEINNSVLDKTKQDIRYLSEKEDKKEDFYFQITNQAGKKMDLPKNERKALVMAMTLHEKGRAALKAGKFDLALLLLLEADQEFKQCTSELLKNVDNYGLLNLDLTWCYLNLNSISQLPNAQLRLEECEKAFHKSYGSNLERLVALKGSSGTEAALFLRLHLLQAIVFYHQGKFEEAKRLFNQVDSELNELKVDEQKVIGLMEFGYSAVDARLGLRQAKGDVNLASYLIENKVAERIRVEKEDMQKWEIKKLEEQLGNCKNGNPVDQVLHASLLSMGCDFDLAKGALRDTNNNLDEALTLIQESPEIIIYNNEDFREQTAQLVALGFEQDMALTALKNHGGNVELALEDLRSNNGVIEGMEPFDGASTSSNNKKIKTQNQWKLETQALKRVSAGISKNVDDYLDLTLTAEEELLRKYQLYIANQLSKFS